MPDSPDIYGPSGPGGWERWARRHAAGLLPERIEQPTPIIGRGPDERDAKRSDAVGESQKKPADARREYAPRRGDDRRAGGRAGA